MEEHNNCIHGRGSRRKITTVYMEEGQERSVSGGEIHNTGTTAPMGET